MIRSLEINLRRTNYETKNYGRDYAEKNGKITSRQAEELLNVKQRRAREVLSKMVDKGTLIKQGAYKSTVYMLNKERGK